VQYRKYHQAQLDVEKEKQQAINDATLVQTILQMSSHVL
jgi:hypothetical protein